MSIHEITERVSSLGHAWEQFKQIRIYPTNITII